MLSEYLQKLQKQKLGDKQKPQLRKRSKKLASEYRKYIPEMKAFLAKNEFCKIRMAGCTGKAVCVHHASGRIGSKLRDQSDWIPSCGSCNLQVEIKDLEAREKGFKKSRLNNQL